ncbi:MAG: S8 family peptidase [Tissierellaceae bacterium]
MFIIQPPHPLKSSHYIFWLMVHGTHVAGIIAGNGFSSMGKYLGIAPKANILGIKALDSQGSGDASDIIEAISYIIETKEKYNTKIINLSLGTPSNIPCQKDPLCKAVDAAVKAGLIVIAAAGNSGPTEGTILSPGISNSVITVGASDHMGTVDTSDDTIAPFSSRGPTFEGLMKPDIVAPGVNIKSLSNVDLDGYSSLSGTSMATPLVSGSAALLLNEFNLLTPQEVKNKVIDSCIDLKDTKENQGAGLLNLKLLFSDGTIDNTKDLEDIADIGFEINRRELLEDLILLLALLILYDYKK